MPTIPRPERLPSRGLATLSESDGVRYLHFGTEWVQGAMRIARPHRLELEYQQQMMAPWLFHQRPRCVLQLGLGAAALAKFCHRYLRGAQVVAVEIDRTVIHAARRWFALPPPDERLRIIEDDAARYLLRAAASADWLQVDLYDAEARGPVFDDLDFYRSCRAALREGGVGAFNLFGGSWRDSATALDEAFEKRWLRLPRAAAGNVIVLAFAGPVAAWEASRIERRGAALSRRFGWPVADWIDGMRAGRQGRPLFHGAADFRL